MEAKLYKLTQTLPLIELRIKDKWTELFFVYGFMAAMGAVLAVAGH